MAILPKSITMNNCIGCKYFAYNNDGSADCKQNSPIYYICPKLNFQFKECDDKNGYNSEH